MALNAASHLIEISDFSAYFEEKKEKDYVVGLDHISLTIDQGDFLCILGPSGCGKTTLLRSILGLIDLTDGKILIEGVDGENLPIQQRNFGYVSQEYSLYPTMTVYDNIAFPLRRMKAPYQEIDSRVKQAAKDLGISYFLSRKPGELSGGQQQKVAIARAIVKNPIAYLFDEPFSNLDPEQRSELRTLVMHLHALLNTTFIFVTHDRDEALTLGNKLAIMNDGHIVQVGTKEEVVKHPDSMFVADFFRGSAYVGNE
ncbi:MAG: ABC transporter ATP-binding protein [Bacilli bacterium]|jgi:ABC-type sugar transport system ATPase subunit|nr:ABC transporter ATP-binding protein [Bacilli bacterium]